MTKSARGGTKAQEKKVVTKKSKRSNKDDEKEKKQKEAKDADADADNAAKLRGTSRKSTPTRVTMGRKDQCSPEMVKNNDNLDFEDDETGGGDTNKEDDKTTNTPKKRGAKKLKKGVTTKETAKASDEHTNHTSNDTTSDDAEKTREEEDLAACCMCHCALDYSDRVAFFEADRLKEIEENKDNNGSSDDDGEPLYFQPTDPYVPQSLYDASNALVYCDGGCKRLYHQKCHFVPLMVVPRGKWTCLVCSTASRLTGSTTGTTTNNKNNNNKNDGSKKIAAKKQDHDVLFTKSQLKHLFQSPPPPAKLQLLMSASDEKDKVYHTKAERQWEIATGRDKAILWHKTLTQAVPSWIQSQMSNLSQAQTALETLTRTKQNRHHFLESKASKRGSQELAQTLVKLAGAKWKMRQMILNLEEIRVNPERHIWLMQQWCRQGVVTADNEHGKDNGAKMTTLAAVADADTTTINESGATRRPPPKSFVDRVIFPFGQHPPRRIPRTPEMLEQEDGDDDEGDGAVPTEIVASNDINKKAKGKKKQAPPKKTGLVKVAKADDDSGVSLEDLKCCVCLIGDANDENDLLMCDAQGCFRAFHMNCLEPRMSLKDVEGTEDEDWFCPLCSNMANCMHTIQSYYMGEEWDQRRRERALAEAKKQKAKGKAGKKTGEEDSANNLDDSDDEDSLKSWAEPDDVFPDSKWEYETALQLKAGERNDDTNVLLQEFLGGADDEGGETRVIDCMSDGTDDEELDAHFDLEAFHEHRRRQYEEMEESDDETTHSSQATLVDMSSVELKIGKDELNALDEGSASDSGDEENEDESEEDGDGSGSRGVGHRRRYRLRRRQSPRDLPKNVGVDFDISNIVQGKRRRKPVDYRKLNDAMFGDLDEKEIAKLDDTEDFHVPMPKKKVSPSSSSGDEGSDSGSGSDRDSEVEGDNNSENEEPDSESGTKGQVENKKSANKKMKENKKQVSKKRKRASSKVDDADSGNDAENEGSSTESAPKKKKKSTQKTLGKAKNSSSTIAKKLAGSKGSKVNGAKALASKKAENGGKSKKPKATESKEKKARKKADPKPTKKVASKVGNGSEQKRRGTGRGAKKTKH